MRATRAYLAGLGTAGSIVVGAALAFVLASAVVAFHGWPGAGGVDAPARVVLSAPARSDTPIARRLVSLVTRSRPGRVRLAPRTAVTPVVHARHSTVAAGTGAGGSGSGVSSLGGRPTARPTQPPPTTRPTQPPASTPGPTTTIPAPATTIPAPPTTISVPPTGGGGTSSPVGTVVRKVTGTVGGTVSGLGSGVGTTFEQVTAPVGGPVSGVGSGAGDTITKVTGRLGAVLGGG